MADTLKQAPGMVWVTIVSRITRQAIVLSLTQNVYTDFRADYHNISCDSHMCHSSGAQGAKSSVYNLSNGIPEFRSCGFQSVLSPEGAGHVHAQPQCHPIFGNLTYPIAGGNANLTNVSTLNASSIDSNGRARVIYSDSTPLDGNPLKLHTAGNNVPCIICHGPNHNIKNPDPSTFNRRMNSPTDPDAIWQFSAGWCFGYCHFSVRDPVYPCKTCHVGEASEKDFSPNFNGSTEISHCQSCHTSKKPHNSSISCTVCHSQDIHITKVFTQNATYINGSTSSFRGNCTSCHQNSTFMSVLLTQPGAGYYSGSAPQVAVPVKHSTDLSSGKKWNSTPGYWTNGTDGSAQLTSCYYCHGITLHSTSALGRPTLWKGSNTVNSSIDEGNWCASCHYQGYSSGVKNYNDMTLTFTSASLSIPPEITNGTCSASIYNRSMYYNHSLKDYGDAACRLCHGINHSPGIAITPFLHSVTWGSCTDCHYSFEAMNSTDRPDRFVDPDIYNLSIHGSLSCSNCHTKGHKNIGARKACEDCHAVQADPITDRDRHNITATPSTYFYNGTGVVNITDCTACHNATLYNTAITTYGYWKPKDCNYCHTYPEKYYE